MDVERNSAFAEALDRASEEAISEIEHADEEVTDEDESQIEDETLEPQEESDEGDESEEVAAESVEDAEPAEQAVSVEWDGNPDNLPETLIPVYKAMQGGFTKKMQEVAERDRQRDELHRQTMAALEKQLKQQQVANDPRPANPTEDMSYDEQQRRWDEISSWTARQAILKAKEDGIIPDSEAFEKKTAEYDQVLSVNRRMQLLQSQDGWGSEVESAMQQIAQSNPYWEQQLKTDEGALALFHFTKQSLEAENLRKTAAELEAEKVKQKARAVERATPAQATQKKAVDISPADRFKDMGFRDKLDAIVDESFEL